MNVSDKTLIIICLIFAFLIAISGAASRTILLSSYLELEEQDVLEKLEIVDNNFGSEVSRISTLNHEWASWDKTYEFMENGNPTYITSYLTDEIFAEAGINFILYANNNGEIVYKKALNLETREEILFPSEPVQMLTGNKQLLARHPGDRKNTIIRSEEGPLIISSHPILTSTGSGTMRGTLVMGRCIDENLLNSLTTIPGLQITLEEAESLESEDSFPIPGLKALTDKSDMDPRVEIIDENRIAGYIPLVHIEENPDILIKVSFPRDLYAQGKKTLLFFIMVFLIACVTVGIATNYLLKRLFISNLKAIEGFVTDVKEENNLSKRLEIGGGDEFIRLSAGINSMLLNLERSRNELMHRESEKQALLNSLNEVLLYFDSELRIVWANGKVYKYFGKKPEEIIGHYHHELWKEKSSLLAPFVKKALKNGKTQSFDVNFREGSNWAVTIGSVRDSEGRLIGAVESILDITEVRKSEEKMLQAKIMAENASRSKSEFMSNMSHELRTPLNSVIGFSDLLKEETFGTLNAKQLKFVNNISTSGKHLLRLINDILDLSKIEAGKMDFHCMEFSVREKLEEVKNTLFPVSSKKKINVTLEIEDGIDTIYTDEGKFVQILYNLLSNAIKFTPENGHVKVTAKKLDDMLEISVKDNGIGISEEDQAKIFHPFVQVDPFPTRKYEGTGLGLALVGQMVKLIGGEIRVHSKPGEGSEFIYTIPLINSEFE